MEERVTAATSNLIMAGLMTGMITISTMIFKIPIPLTTGYIHLGDSMIFLAVLILGWKYSAVAAGIGSALADVIGGFAMWAPWTFCIKAVMAVLMGYAIKKQIGGDKKIFGLPVCQLVGMVLSGVWMVAGYYVAEGVMYSNFVVATIAIPWNLVQFVMGFIIAGLIAAALLKTSAKRFFKY